jgi:hypothetical protein
MTNEYIKRKLRLITRYDPPPIPRREFDWIAISEDYDLGSHEGYGRTEREAIKDWIQEAVARR